MENILKQRNLPPFLSREEMLEILQREEYGYMPPKPDSISFSDMQAEKMFKTGTHFCAGKASFKRVMITTGINGKTFSFPISVVIPTSKGPHPFFIHINFRPYVPDIYMPTEEIVDNGFAIISFNYEDITLDNDTFDSGLSLVLYPDGTRKPHDCGKIAMWAWGAQRAMDYAQTLSELNKDYAVVCGHSRNGKAALLAAATDERFTFAYSNGAGCSGSCITRQKNGERVKEITTNFPAWFCENYKKYSDSEDKMPFDQHYLAALIAPRYLAMGSDDDGPLSDAVSDMLTCVSVSKVYEDMCKVGFIYDGKIPTQGCVWHDGSVGYHVRKGLHYFDRYDWNMLMSFVKKHMKY